MRILHVIPTYLPATRYGGPIVAAHALARALIARGHDVEVHGHLRAGDLPGGGAVLIHYGHRAGHQADAGRVAAGRAAGLI